MRGLATLALLALACSGGGSDGVPGSLTLRPKGLYLTAADVAVPDGALAQADNVNISRDGIVETRRGMEVKGAKALTRLFPYKDALIGHNGSSLLSYSSDSGVTWSDYSAAVTPPSGYPVRTAEVSSNLFLTDQSRPKRLDALAGTPEESGVPAALDVELALSSVGSPTAMPTNSQLAYRMLFGKRDANKRLLLGAPSSRGVIANAAGATRDVTVAYSVPQGLDSSHFFQVYRTTKSATSSTDPGDEMGLVYEGAVPLPVSLISLSRTTNVVTATLLVDHGFSVGQIVRISPGGGAAGSTVALGASSAKQRSTDNGATWSSAGMTVPTATWNAIASGGTIYVAVGASTTACSSSDGLTWTTRTIAVSGDYYDVANGGGRFAAVGYTGSTAIGSYSTDGTTWTASSVTNASSATMLGVAWNGSLFLAVGVGGTAGYARTSSNGSTWSAPVTIAANFTPYSVTWTGNDFIAVGTTGTAVAVYTSHNGITWSAASITADFGQLRSVTWTGTAAVAVGTSGKAYYSTTGTSWTGVTLAGSFMKVVWDGTAVIAVGTNVAATATANGQTWTTRTITAGAYTALGALPTGAVFAASEVTVASIPTAKTFTYAETGADGALSQAQTATPLTGIITDTVPDGFLGAALYTNANQEGILNANERPPLARELAEFRGSLFAANITTSAYASVYLLAVGGSNGLAADDTVTINGVVYTGKASESISAKQFKVSTSGTISENIRDTAASLLRVVNRSQSSGATITDISDPAGTPGQMEIRNIAPSGNLTVAFSRLTAWSPTSISEAPKNFKNGIVWSKQYQPDHFPKSQILTPTKVGLDDKAILRVIPTRSALFVLKEDGIWKVTGDAGQFSIDPFDPTIHVVGAETAALLDNTIFALSEQGVVRISDTGVAVVSRPIETALLALIAPALRATTKSYGFGVGYESDRKYLLWLPSASTDTQATQAYVFDTFTGAWTRRTDDFSHATVNPFDDRLYAVDGTSAWQERKTLDDTDLADRSYSVTISSGGGTTSVVLADATNAAVGDAIAQGAVYAVITAKNSNTLTLDRAAALTNAAATVYRAISTVVKWSPKFGGGPLFLTELQEAVFLWQRVYFASASVGYASNISPTESALTLLGSDYAWTGSAQTQVEIRSWPPTDKGWGSQFNISVSHAQAWSPNAISGLGLSFKSQSSVVSR